MSLDNQANVVASGTVYVVDDEELLIQVLTTTIGQYGFKVKGFTQPPDLLAAVKAEIPDVIISDIRMPIMSGIDLCYEIQKIDSDLPVILISGHFTNEQVMNIPGVYILCEKPFKAAQLITLIINAVQKYRMSKFVKKSMQVVMEAVEEMDKYLKSEHKDDLRKKINDAFYNLVDMQHKLI